MSRVGIIVQARLASTRLPGKILMDLNGKPLLQWVVDAAREAAAFIDEAQVCVVSPDLCPGYEVGDFAGVPVLAPTFKERDVVREYADAAVFLRVDHIIRLTADCPMLTAWKIVQDWDRCEPLVSRCQDFYYYHGPDGLDVEITSRNALSLAMSKATGEDREHVLSLLRRTEDLWRIYDAAAWQQEGVRSVNTQQDLDWVRERMQNAS